MTWNVFVELADTIWDWQETCVLVGQELEPFGTLWDGPGLA